VAAKTRAALGFSVHIGRAAVVAVGGAPEAPEILGKAALQVATTFEEGAVFHMGQELPPDEARALIRDSDARFAERARAQLAAFVAQLGAGAGARADQKQATLAAWIALAGVR
jgi:hypothetical protein